MSEPLKPCPFCSGETTLSYGYEPQTKANYVTCDGCFCRGPACEPEQDDEAVWNTRPEPDVVEQIADWLENTVTAAAVESVGGLIAHTLAKRWSSDIRSGAFRGGKS